MKHTSTDGLFSANDPQAVATWDRIGVDMAAEQRRASATLRNEGVKLEHPDDGWVDRERNVLNPCYPAFNDGPQVGDLIALGWPWRGYRLVRVADTQHRSGILISTTHYSFEDTGRRVTLEKSA